MKKFTKIQLEIIIKMLKIDVLATSNFVKEHELKRAHLWRNIYELEDLGLIERVNSSLNQKTRIKHKKLFDEALLKDKYNIEFPCQDIELANEKIERDPLKLFETIEKIKKLGLNLDN
ncbi:MAG: hypothetical protein L3J10_04810 [Sulfurimonas sp.]|nr:hypothetical protein [Sulfurimonas sp.]